MFENKTYNDIKDNILNNCELDIAKNEGSFLNDISSATAFAHASFYAVLDKIFNIAFLKESFEDNIDKRVKEFGIERKEGKQAIGQANFKGISGSIVESGTIIIANGKRYEVLDNQNGNIESEEDGITLYVRAMEIGTDSNLNTITSFELEEQNDSITSITSVGNITGGLDEETDEELKERFFYLQAHKGTSGNEDDYVNWSLEIEGVKKVRVIPLWNGNGTVKVVIMSDNNRNVDPSIVSAAQTYINTKKPIGANVTVVTPTVLEVNINATIEIDKNANLELIKVDIRENIEKYLNNSVNEVTYTKIAGIISNTVGVIDYKNLTVNNSTSNIKLQNEQVGSVGTINLSEGSVD